MAEKPQETEFCLVHNPDGDLVPLWMEFERIFSKQIVEAFGLPPHLVKTGPLRGLTGYQDQGIWPGLT